MAILKVDVRPAPPPQKSIGIRVIERADIVRIQAQLGRSTFVTIISLYKNGRMYRHNINTANPGFDLNEYGQVKEYDDDE